MQQTSALVSATSNPKIRGYVLVVVFLLIASILFSAKAFPALYGDEYSSLLEAQHLTSNIHAAGYLSQLYIWSFIVNSDFFLRVLSILWFGAGLYWLNCWLHTEEISDQIRNLVVWLALLNPFLWMYGFQIRFYAMFFGTSVLFLWRFREWQKFPRGRNALYLPLSIVLLLTSHLFGTLVLVTTVLHFLWTRLGNKRWILGFLVAVGVITTLLLPVRSALINLVYRMTANPPPIDTASRGLSLGMLIKVPLAFYFFILGERVYPLWWWVTLPAMAILAIAFLLGLWQLRRLPDLASLIVLMLLNVPVMFLVLDPLAPPGLQGAAPRYLIFVLPYFLLLLALGAQIWLPLKPALLIVSLAGMYFLARPHWSYGGGDVMNWPRELGKTLGDPGQTCVITDGRAQAPVMRYVPAGTKVALMGTAADCLEFSRIVLVSNDFRLFQVRYFDEMARGLSKNYALVSNMTLFPAQITVYEKARADSPQFVPSRLDLPEQDLHFPIFLPAHKWQINGFARLDDKTPFVTIPLASEDLTKLWILTNYRAERLPQAGTPMFSLHFSAAPEHEGAEVILHTGEETASWDGSCNACVSVYTWTKFLHLLGSYAYPGAYQQYQAHVWGFPLNLADQNFEIRDN